VTERDQNNLIKQDIRPFRNVINYFSESDKSERGKMKTEKNPAQQRKHSSGIQVITSWVRVCKTISHPLPIKK
jgi:hypothetical protein